MPPITTLTILSSVAPDDPITYHPGAGYVFPSRCNSSALFLFLNSYFHRFQTAKAILSIFKHGSVVQHIAQVITWTTGHSLDWIRVCNICMVWDDTSNVWRNLITSPESKRQPRFTERQGTMGVPLNIRRGFASAYPSEKAHPPDRKVNQLSEGGRATAYPDAKW